MGRIRLEQVKPEQTSKLRELNQKLFPILSIAETSNEFYQMFTNETTGFAFIAYYSEMIAGAVCCELSDNNSLYIRLIGTLNRHRRWVSWWWHPSDWWWWWYYWWDYCSCYVFIRKGVGKALLSRVFKEAETRDIHNIYTFVRIDNKAGFALGRKLGLVTKGPSKHDQSLIMVEKIFHGTERRENVNRSI